MPERDIILAPNVEEELWAIWTFIAEDNANAATSVIESAYETFEAIALNPKMGRLRKFQNQRLKGVRSWPILKFKRFLIFYRPIPTGIQILHVYHGARNLDDLI